MTITIRQIADKAGVSRGTVDRVLNGRYGVKPEVRERVLAIAEELNYVPNQAGKALAYHKKPAIIGIIMPPEHIRFFDQVRAGIYAAAAELKDMGVRLAFSYVESRDPRASADAIREHLGAGVNGILYSSIDDPLVREGISAAADLGVPVVTFNSDVEQCKRVCFVGQDLYKSGYIAAGLMRKMLPPGAEVAVLLGNLRFYAHRERATGFADGAATPQHRLEVVRVSEVYDRYEDTFRQVDDILKASPDLGGLYLATGDVGACVDAVRLHGKEGKVRIVCNDLLPEVERGLRDRVIDFSIMQNPEQQGYRSLRILYDLVFSGKQPETEYYYTETNIYIPESL